MLTLCIRCLSPAVLAGVLVVATTRGVRADVFAFSSVKPPCRSIASGWRQSDLCQHHNHG